MNQDSSFTSVSWSSGLLPSQMHADKTRPNSQYKYKTNYLDVYHPE